MFSQQKQVEAHQNILRDSECKIGQLIGDCKLWITDIFSSTYGTIPMKSMYVFLIVLCCAVMRATAKTWTMTLTISTVRTALPEGIMTNKLGINGAFHGPDIIVGPGDRIIATVINNLPLPTHATTMHWHGIRQIDGKNNMDGVPFVTQPPIQPGETFVYDFNVDGVGTYWYHSHVLDQYVDGLLGALIVRDPAETSIYNDVIMLIKDYYRSLTDSYLPYYLSPFSDGAEPVPDNVLINGVGQTAGCRAAKNCNYTTALASTFTQTCGMYSTYAAVLAAQAVAKATTVPTDNKITRLRFIAGNAITVLNVSVDGHNMWVLSLDGQAVQPVRVTSLLLNAGQRVDVALCRQVGSQSVSQSV